MSVALVQIWLEDKTLGIQPSMCDLKNRSL